MPASGYLEVPTVRVRAAPSESARVVASLTQFDPAFRPRVVLALDAREGPTGEASWYRLSLPGRPNGRTGWVPSATVSLKPVYKEIVVHRGVRTLEVRDHGRTTFRTRVAVGKPGAETPLGIFYVIWGFRPPDPFLGPWAFATSGYSRLTDWPGGGIVGIHGTSEPQSIGRAASHGCVRLYNRDILVLKRTVGPGTPVRILR
jgi:lipoprotein-anchoring transpeptidase ErfK/SrfK